jgi:hypothetical protein
MISTIAAGSAREVVQNKRGDAFFFACARIRAAQGYTLYLYPFYKGGLAADPAVLRNIIEQNLPQEGFLNPAEP